MYELLAKCPRERGVKWHGSPFSQRVPWYPGGQTQWPVLGWQLAPFPQSHCSWQRGPCQPGGHAETQQAELSRGTAVCVRMVCVCVCTLPVVDKHRLKLAMSGMGKKLC